MESLADFDEASLADRLAGWDLPPSHARRLLRGFYDDPGGFAPSIRVHGKGVVERFKTDLTIWRSTLRHIHASADGTRKLLIGLDLHDSVEAVLMPSHRDGLAAGCISAQVGCAMGCGFCASTRGGLTRNLSAGEIVEQFLHLRAQARAMGRRIATLVFMGMGEPLHNLPAVLGAIPRIGNPGLGNLGARRMTVSTVGIVPGIDALAAADTGVHLALSLHAPDDATRDRIVPLNRKYPVAAIMAAAKRFYARTGRPVNIEYCLLGDVNDSDAQAESLAALMAGFAAHVNLIPYNAIGTGIDGVEYRRPASERVAAFIDILRRRGVVAHVRQPRGDDVSAACGQLAGGEGQLTVDG